MTLSAFILLIASAALLFGAGYLARCLRPNVRVTEVSNPKPYPTADLRYHVVHDRGGNLALTDEQLTVARERAARLGL